MSARMFRAPLLKTAGAVLAAAPAVLAFGQEAVPVASSAPTELAGRVGQGIGPPGGEVRSLSLAPSDAGRLYLGTANGHVYRSVDGAGSWQESGLRLPHAAVVDNILVHPQDADRVWVAFWTPSGTGGLRFSHDGGDSWEALDAVLGTPSLRAIAISPSRLDTLYVGGLGGVWRTDDAGASWRNVNGAGLATEFVESLAVDPRDPEHVYAGTWRQVYRSRDGGSRWARIYQGMALDRDVFSLVISPHDPETVFAGTCNFLYCSRDAGATWGERREGLDRTHNRIHTILPDPRDESVVYAGTRGALYRSGDGGMTWQVLEGGIAVSALALDPESGRLFVGTEERGVLVGMPEAGLAEHNKGLFSSRVAAFDTLPGAPRIVFAARRDGIAAGTVHYSTDLGSTWRQLGRSHRAGEILAIRAQTEPVNRVIVVGRAGWFTVAPGGRWDEIPAPPGDFEAMEIVHGPAGAILAATSEGVWTAASADLVGADGAARAFDESPVWRPLWQGGGLDALTTAGDGTFLAVGRGVAVHGPWRPAASDPVERSEADGIEAPVVGLAGHPATTDVAYAITSRHVYLTRDQGRSWERLPLPWGAGDLRAVAVDPRDPDRVLALDYKGAIYRGHGGGQHWLVLDEDPGLHRAWDLRLPASAPGFALVATQGHGLRVVDLDPLVALPVETGVGRDEE